MNSDLARAITNVVTQLGATSASLTASSRVESLYEGYVLACVIEALSQIGGQFEVRDQNDVSSTVLIFRTKPGLIYTPGVPYTYVLVRLGTAEFELHTDMRVVGKSKVLHELDVALLDRDECVRCRQAGVSPRQSKIRFLAECKFYGRSLPLRLGREFLGLSSEFSLRVKTIVSNVGNDNIHRMITSHRGTENFDVSPLTPAKVQMFVQWLAKELTQVLR